MWAFQREETKLQNLSEEQQIGCHWYNTAQHSQSKLLELFMDRIYEAWLMAQKQFSSWKISDLVERKKQFFIAKKGFKSTKASVLLQLFCWPLLKTNKQKKKNRKWVDNSNSQPCRGELPRHYINWGKWGWGDKIGRVEDTDVYCDLKNKIWLRSDLMLLFAAWVFSSTTAQVFTVHQLTACGKIRVLG